MRDGQVESAIRNAQAVSHQFSADDTAPAFIIQSVTYPDDAITAATIAFIQGGAMTFLVGGIAPTGKWAIGTAGVIDTSAGPSDTVGEIQDLVNATLGHRMILVGAERATLMAEILAKSAASSFGANGLVFYSDTTASDELAFAISGEKFVNHGINGHVKDWDDKCLNILDYFNFNMGITGNGTVKILIGKQGETEVEALSWPIVDDTLLAKGLDQPGASFYEAKWGHRLIVKITAVTSIDDYAVCDAGGRTAVISESRVVNEKNY